MQCAPSYVLLTLFETTTCALLYCLLYKGECYFGICEATFYLVASFHSTFKVFIIPIYLYTKACVKNKLLALNCQEINQYVSCVRSFTSRDGVVGFYPIFGQRLPTLMSLRSPTQTLGCQCGFTGSTGPVTTTRINLTSL